VVLGSAQIHFIDDKSKLDQVSEVRFLTPVTVEAVPVKWEAAAEVNQAQRASSRTTRRTA
jgi:hypothetical protein